MMSEKNKGGRPQLPDAEKARVRSIRMTDADWADAMLIGMEKVRALVRRQAKKMRKAKMGS